MPSLTNAISSLLIVVVWGTGAVAIAQDPVAADPLPPGAQQPETVEEVLPPESEAELVEAGIFPPASSKPGKRLSPQPVEYSYDAVTEGAFDAVGSWEPEGAIGPRSRPTYPYGHDEKYWYGHDAKVEEWGDLLELPHVRLGWFSVAEATVFDAWVSPDFNSGTALDATFPGDPVTLGAANLNWSVMPKVEVGYRFEHGLGEIRGTYRLLSASGSDPLPGYDTSGGGTLHTTVENHIVDLDFYTLEFNPEGLPFLMPLLKFPGRLGLGKPLTRGILVPPLEIRWYFGARFVTSFYESTGSGNLLEERVVNNFTGGGVHFGIDLNQRLPTEAPLFMHLRADGSGIFGLLNQTFYRTQTGAGPPISASGGVVNDSIGVPTVNLECGMSWVPNWPNRDLRFTCAYQFEEWFSFAATPDSNAQLLLNGILLRSEYKF